MLDALRRGPVRITMNDGSVFSVPSIELCAVTDISAYLVTLAEDGKWRGRHLALVCMVSVEEVSRLCIDNGFTQSRQFASRKATCEPG